MTALEAYTLPEQLTILDETAPRLEEYASPKEWYSALTEWFISAGLKVQQLPEPERECQQQNPTEKQPNTNEWNGNIGRAAYLLGVLALEGCVVIDLDNQESVDNFGYALRVLTRHLEQTEPDEPGELPYIHD